MTDPIVNITRWQGERPLDEPSNLYCACISLLALVVPLVMLALSSPLETISVIADIVGRIVRR